jgi:hypothetical protein
MFVQTVFWHASVQASVAVGQVTQLDLLCESHQHFTVKLLALT